MENSINVIDPAVDPRIDSHIKTVLNMMNSAGGPPLESLPAPAVREIYGGMQTSVEQDLSGVTILEKEIKADGLIIKLFVVRPADVEGDIPAFMYFHGGGWVIGDFADYQRLVRDLVVASGFVAVFVEYSRSPEAQFPVAINELYTATKWVAENGHEIGIDGKKLAVVGNSVGGNMATVIAMMAKEKNSPEIKTQILLWPVTDANYETESYNKYATGRLLTKSLMIWLWDSYTTDEDERNHRYVSPLRATTEQLKGLPPAVILTAENDILHDDGVNYARKLDEAGVPVVSVTFNGMIHDWSLLNMFANLPAASSAVSFVAMQLKNTFS